MTEQEIRQQIHTILDSHAEVLVAIRTAHSAMKQAFDAHDAALVSAINANGAALKLLNRMMDEGIKE